MGDSSNGRVFSPANATVTLWSGTDALQHCKTPAEQVDVICEYVSDRSQFPDRRVEFNCDPFFIICLETGQQIFQVLCEH